jgi:hypothetical protein
MKPIDQARFGAIGTGKAAVARRDKLRALEARSSPDAVTLLGAGLYIPLLAWVESVALQRHHISPPWRPDAHVAAFFKAGGVEAASFRPAVFTVPSRFFTPAGFSGAAFNFRFPVVDAEPAAALAATAPVECEDAEMADASIVAAVSNESAGPIALAGLAARMERRHGKRRVREQGTALGGGWVHEE